MAKSKKLVIVLLTAVFIGLVLAITSSLTGGRVSPLSNLVNIVATPVSKGVNWVTGGVGSFFDHFVDYDNLKEENQRLTGLVGEYETKIRLTEKLEQENNLLRSIVGIKEKSPELEFRVAEITGKSYDPWSSTFSIDKGSLNSVKVGDPVISDQGMVGYVSKVGTTWAEVTSIIDPATKVGAVVTRTRNVSVAQGDFEQMQEGFLKLMYLPKDSDLVVGDTIETSGQGSYFPKGLLIGTVAEIKTEVHGISNYAIIKPAVDFEKITQVAVIVEFGKDGE